MKHLLWFVLFLGAIAHAQSCSNSNGIPQWSQATPVVGTPDTVNVTFTSATALVGAVLDIEIHDSSGNKVAQSWQGSVNLTACQSVSAQPYAWVPSSAGQFTVEVGIANSANTMLWFNNNAGTIPVSAALVQVPPCYPSFPYSNVDYGFIPSGISSRYDVYGIWVCNTPSGYQVWHNMGLLSNVASYVLNFKLGTWTAAQAQADCAANCVPFTASELTWLQTMEAKDTPKCLVAFNGAALTRSVYGLNSDGTLNTTPMSGVTVAVGATCDATNRIPTAPAYYAVSGGINASGGAIPINSYAIGAISLPLGTY